MNKNGKHEEALVAEEELNVSESFTDGGQSGSPVWRIKNGKRYAVEIHTNGSSLGNSATRITKPVFKNLKKWKNMYK